MTLHISEVCDLYAWLYTDLAARAGTWDHVFPVDGAFVAVKVIDDTAYVCWRGSVTVLDWIEDITRVAQPLVDPVLGPVHPGFALGVQAVLRKVNEFVAGNKVIVVGHSLGAGHAAIYAGYRLAVGSSVDRVIMFGEPRAGCSKLAGILSQTKLYSFRNEDANGHDYVTDVPAPIPLLAPYVHPTTFTDVSASPVSSDRWGLFRYHHFGLYCRALGAAGAASQSLPGYHG